MSPTHELLAEYAKLINRFGPDSPEANEFIARNKHQIEFVELAEVSRKLKKVLTRTACSSNEKITG